MWKLFKGLEAVTPTRRERGPQYFRHNKLAPLKHCCVPGELLLKGTLWAVAREAAGAAIQVVLSLCHHLQSVLDTTDLVPKQSLALQRHPKAARAQACPGCVGSGMSQPWILCPALERGCVSQGLMAKASYWCSYWNSAASLAHLLSAPTFPSVPTVCAIPAETAVSVWEQNS